MKVVFDIYIFFRLRGAREFGRAGLSFGATETFRPMHFRLNTDGNRPEAKRQF